MKSCTLVTALAISAIAQCQSPTNSISEKYKQMVLNSYVNAYVTIKQNLDIFNYSGLSKKVKEENATYPKAFSIKDIEHEYAKRWERYYQSHQLDISDGIKYGSATGQTLIGLSKAGSPYAKAVGILGLIVLENEMDKIAKENEKYASRMDVTKNGLLLDQLTFIGNRRLLKNFAETDFSSTDFKNWANNSGVSQTYANVLESLSVGEQKKYLSLLQAQAKRKLDENLNIEIKGDPIGRVAATQNVKMLLSLDKRQAELGQKIESIGKRVDNINNALNSLTKKVNDVSSLSRHNTADIEYLKLTMYSNLSSEQKLMWIKSNFLNLPEDERKFQELKLMEVMINQERINLARDVSDYCQLASAAFSFLEAAGIKDPNVKKLTKAANYAAQGTEVAMSFLTGNYISAINGLGGMLFGRKNNPNQQILNMLVEQDKKLNQIIDMQIQTLKMLDQINKNLVELIKRQEFFFNEILNELYDIKYGLKISLDLQREITGEPLKLGSDFLNDFLRLPSLSEKIEYWKSFPDVFNRVNTGLGTLSSPGRISPYFHLAYSESANGNIKFRNDFFDPLRADYFKVYPELAGSHKFSAFLSAYSPDYVSLKEKIKYAKYSKNVLPVFKGDEFEWLLDSKNIIEFSEVLMQFGRLRIFADEEETLQRMKEPHKILIASNHSQVKLWNDKTVQQLRFANKIIDIAIAQQQLLSGDLLIPHYVSEIANSEIQSMLSKNVILKENVGLYFFKERGEMNNVDKYAYEFAFATKDTFLLREVFKNTTNMPEFYFVNDTAKVEGKDSVILSINFLDIEEQTSAVNVDGTEATTKLKVLQGTDVKFHLPSPENYKAPVFIFHPTLPHLIHLKSAVLNEIALYTFKTNLFPSEIKETNAIPVVAEFEFKIDPALKK